MVLTVVHNVKITLCWKFGTPFICKHSVHISDGWKKNTTSKRNMVMMLNNRLATWYFGGLEPILSSIGWQNVIMLSFFGMLMVWNRNLCVPRASVVPQKCYPYNILHLFWLSTVMSAQTTIMVSFLVVVVLILRWSL